MCFSFIRAFSPSPGKSFIEGSYGPGTVLSIGVMVVNKTAPNPCPLDAYILMEPTFDILYIFTPVKLHRPFPNVL